MCSFSLGWNDRWASIVPTVLLCSFSHKRKKKKNTKNEMKKKNSCLWIWIYRWCRNHVAVRSCAAKWRTRRRSSGWTSAWSSTLKTSSRSCSTRRIVRSSISFLYQMSFTYSHKKIKGGNYSFKSFYENCLLAFYFGCDVSSVNIFFFVGKEIKIKEPYVQGII